MQVESSWSAGQHEDARSHSRVAKMLNIIGIAVGIALWISVAIGVVYYIATIAAFSARTTGNSNRPFG